MSFQTKQGKFFLFEIIMEKVCENEIMLAIQLNFNGKPFLLINLRKTRIERNFIDIH